MSGDSQLNPSLSHKQAVAILNLEALSARMGVKLNKADLCARLRSESIRFPEDGRCDLVGHCAALRLHEEALQSARKCGLQSYVRFFEREEPDVRPSRRTRMDPDVLSDEDLELLREAGATALSPESLVDDLGEQAVGGADAIGKVGAVGDE